MHISTKIVNNLQVVQVMFLQLMMNVMLLILNVQVMEYNVLLQGLVNLIKMNNYVHL